MEVIQGFFLQIYGTIKSFTFFDLIDILIIAYITYKFIFLVRETRAGQLVKGIILLALAYFLAQQFNLKTVSFVLQNLFQIGILALIILFQPEIRRALEKFGRTKVANLSMLSSDGTEKNKVMWTEAIENICIGVANLSSSKTGALIVFERKTRLGEQIATGIELNAKITVELIGNIFFVNTPLHDGAVIVRGGRILAAACFLPKPQKEEYIASNLGSRHRAAIGISEISDSVTVVVSEETGTISIAENGQLIRNFTADSLKQFLLDRLIPEKTADEKKDNFLFRRIFKK